MNLIKKNIHMDCLKSKASNQITLEEDFNLPDVKPDMDKIIFKEGDVRIDEVKASGDHVTVRGKLLASLLYASTDSGEKLARVEKEMPFEETVFLEGVESGDNVDYTYEIEDFSVSMINSRKASIRSIITLKMSVRELYDEETATELYGEEEAEYRKRCLDIAEIAICKKDIYRIRQEIEFPAGMPNIAQIIWNSIRIGNLDFKALDGKISVQGELEAFFLFEGEGEDRPVRFYETTMPFSGVIECNDCRETMIPDITWQISHKEFEVRPDFDGEERVVALEIVLDLNIKMYEEERVEILSDVYGVTKEITAVTLPGSFKSLLVKNEGKCRVADKLKIEPGAGKILQLMHSEAEAVLDETKIVEDGLELNGTLLVNCLYVTGDDKMPYSSLQGMLPFSYVMDVSGINSQCTSNVAVSVEQLNVTMLDSEELEVKAVVRVHAIVFCEQKEDMITDIQVQDLDMDKVKNLPSMAIHVAGKDDSLWQIGKKYYVSVKKIKELNGLSGDDLKEGDKLFIVKGVQK
ncbi:MAG: DUF3794 domain-containing protein [Lachnospiraceae bacterium]|nr:DUF3794 domain-containing protein [Lachnospiraceae bacterium]